MKVTLLDGKPMPYEYTLEGQPVCEMYVHGVSVEGGDEGARLDRIRFVLEEDGSEKLSRTVEGAELDYNILHTSRRLPAFRKFEVNFTKRFAAAPRELRDLADSRDIPPSGEAWLLDFMLSGKGVFPSHLRIEATAGEETVSTVSRLTLHKSEKRYRLPFDGPVFAAGGPAGGYGHREVSDQEFAVDILPLDDGLRVFTGEGGRNEDFTGYRRDILAPADGTVVRVLDGKDDNPTVMEVPKITREDIDRWGLERVTAGNHLVVDHGDGEFSLFAHCSKGIPVREGQEVKTGDRLAAVGNNGNSEAPHLHFHVMDGPDMLQARSLPFALLDVELLPMCERFGALRLPYERTICRNA